MILRLNEEELAMLDVRVQRSGLTRQAYLRHLIKGYVPRAAPPEAFEEVMRQLSSIGNNLNQIAQKAHRLNVMDVQQYDANVRMLSEVTAALVRAVVSPQPMREATFNENDGADDRNDVSVDDEPATNGTVTFEDIFGHKLSDGGTETDTSEDLFDDFSEDDEESE